MPANTLSSTLIDAFEDAIDAKISNQSKPVSTRRGKITRIDDSGMAWVHVEGGVPETPVNGGSVMSVGNKDEVLVSISDGRCSVTGNLTNPATDDTAAIEAEKSARRVTKKISEVERTVATLDQGLRSEVRMRQELNGEIRETYTKIEQNDREISMVAGEVENVSGRLATAETQITQNATAIESKASIDSVDTLAGRVTDAESTLTQQATKIESTVTKVETVETDLTAFKSAQDSMNDYLQDQIDGSISTWFYEGTPHPDVNDEPGTVAPNAPAIEWVTEEDKNIHLGDLYYDTETGYCYRWMVSPDGDYYWTRVTDSDVTLALAKASQAQDTADGKRTIFSSEPTVPYQISDLWIRPNPNGGSDVYQCQVGRSSTDTYHEEDWTKVDSADLESFKINTKTNFEQTDVAITATVERVEAGEKTLSMVKQTVDGWTFEVKDEDGNVTETLIKGGEIVTGSVTGDKIAAGTITGENIDAGTITADNLAAGSITTEKLAAEAITAEKIAAGTITGKQISAGTITGDLIAAKSITAGQIDTDSLQATFLRADFANFESVEATAANIWKLYALSGIISNVTASDGTITHLLQAVEIRGDLIQANTINASKINIIGENGIIKQINLEGLAAIEDPDVVQDITNGLNGQILIAKSVTADRIAVTDLTAFDATIAGIVMTPPSEETVTDDEGNETVIFVPGKMHTSTKDSTESPLPGFYLDSNGCMVLGDDSKYIKFHNPDDPNGSPTELEMRLTRLSLETGDLVTSDQLQTFLTFENNEGLTLGFGMTIDDVDLAPGMVLTHVGTEPAIQFWRDVDHKDDEPLMEFVGNKVRMGSGLSSPELDVGDWRWSEVPAADESHGTKLELRGLGRR